MPLIDVLKKEWHCRNVAAQERNLVKQEEKYNSSTCKSSKPISGAQPAYLIYNLAQLYLRHLGVKAWRSRRSDSCVNILLCMHTSRSETVTGAVGSCQTWFAKTDCYEDSAHLKKQSKAHAEDWISRQSQQYECLCAEVICCAQLYLNLHCPPSWQFFCAENRKCGSGSRRDCY